MSPIPKLKSRINAHSVQSPPTKILRVHFKQARQSLNPWHRHIQTVASIKALLRSPSLRKAKHIALYFPCKNEFDCSGLQKILLAQGKYCYLPCTSGNRTMRFRRVFSHSQYKTKTFGIKEPKHGSFFHAKRLDCVITPLLGFDMRGSRLGMGGGFYDYNFRFKSRQTQPKLIGVGYKEQCFNFQTLENFETKNLKREAWDIPLDAVVFSGKHRKFK